MWKPIPRHFSAVIVTFSLFSFFNGREEGGGEGASLSLSSSSSSSLPPLALINTVAVQSLLLPQRRGGFEPPPPPRFPPAKKEAAAITISHFFAPTIIGFHCGKPREACFFGTVLKIYCSEATNILFFPVFLFRELGRGPDVKFIAPIKSGMMH